VPWACASNRGTAERTVRALDRAQSDYLRQFYAADINDPSLYHLTIDATRPPPPPACA
jgi:cytidylate kinase